MNQDKNNKAEEAYRNLRQFWTSAPNRDPNVVLPSLKTLDKIARFVSPGEYFFYLFNLATAQIDHASETARDILGIPPEELSINKLLGCVHPEQLEGVQLKESVGNTFFLEVIPPHLMNKYKLVYTYRVITPAGKTLNLLHQSLPIHENEQGNYRYTLNIDVDVTNWNIPINNNVSFISRDGQNRSYYNIDAQKPDFEKAASEDSLFTQREIEVLDFVAQGLSNNEIAEKLKVSASTVDTHRRNMLAKSGQNTINQLVANSVRAGII